jgi:uncharacterized protein with PIN domain
MKKIKCLDCEKVFEAETEEEAMQKMHPHYMEDHKDVMAEGTEEKKKAWMEKFYKNWEEAKEE